MQLSDYTPDNICRSLGLPSFRDDPTPGSSSQVLRVLLMPSFHPELCLTLEIRNGMATIEARVLHAHFWAQPALGGRIPTSVDTGRPTAEIATDLLRHTRNTIEAALTAPARQCAMRDGMAIAVWLREPEGSLFFEDNGSFPDLAHGFVAALLQVGFETTTDLTCRNAIARAARHVGLKLPLAKLPE